MLGKDSQSAKAKPPINVTDSGIVMLAKELHFRKAPLPMVVTDSGMAMLAKDLQPSKAATPMAVTDSGLPPSPPGCSLGRLEEEFRERGRDVDLEESPLHGLPLSLRLQLRF